MKTLAKILALAALFAACIELASCRHSISPAPTPIPTGNGTGESSVGDDEKAGEQETAKTCAVTLMNGKDEYARVTMTCGSTEIKDIPTGKSLILPDAEGYFAGWGTSDKFGVESLTAKKPLLSSFGTSKSDIVDTLLIGKDGKLKEEWTDESAEKTLYSYWTDIAFFTATFETGDDAIENPDDEIVWENDEDKTIALPTPSDRRGYTFAGWQVEGDDKVWNAEETYTLDGDKNFVAVWTAKTCTISLDAQDGTGGTERVTATFGQAMPEIVAPTKAGYGFAGFFDGKDGAGTQYYDAKGKSAKNWDKDAETATLYAKWGPEWQTFSLAEAIETLNAADKDKDIFIKIVDDEATDFGTGSYSSPIGEAILGYNDKSGKVSLDLTGMTNLTSISDHAFCMCESLSSIEIPDGVKSIDKQALSTCRSLASIEIPASVTSIGFGAFFDYDIVMTLSKVTFAEGSQLESIGDDAFYGCSSLASIDIPDSVTSIGDGAFGWCHSLSSINIPASVTTIGRGAFRLCSSLATVNFEGTKEQWNTISKGYSWKSDCPFTVVKCSDGDVSIE